MSRARPHFRRLLSKRLKPKSLSELQVFKVFQPITNVLEPQRLNGQVRLASDGFWPARVEQGSVTIASEGVDALPDILRVVGIHGVEIELSVDVVEEGQGAHGTIAHGGMIHHG